ncbi:hypothetical protein FGO68_gene13202 [Halteria grandinella]|uniref:Uncharacterized protein n=1 Tax=Halteria grandinella TaxID=5974 RepID=A0A8J8SXD3_HALGN|nr:hypothetical protein FGO68_gene13202 [Halteria grandinella]
MLSNREAADAYQITYSHNTINFNGMTLRPGSPRTMNACSMLGIDTQVFQLKQLLIKIFREQNDFSDGSNNPEIIKIRYQHYVNKTHCKLINDDRAFD